MFGLSLDKVIILVAIAAFLIGPQHLPAYAAKLGQFVRAARDLALTAKERARAEFGDEFDDFEWKRLDPTQYDPRRIIRDALTGIDEAAPVAKTTTASEGQEPSAEQ
jgi:sec-independent protein translocase protein TatB